MKKLKSVLIGILSIVTLVSCETESIETDLSNEQSANLSAKLVENSKVHQSKLQNRVINSDALQGNFAGNAFTRKLQIYTPPGYSKNGTQQYPVVYLLHGFPFSEKAFIERHVWDEWITPYLFSQEYPDFPEEGFRHWVDNLIAEGFIEPMIIVMPDAGTAPYGFSFYSNSMLNGDFEDFIINDLVNYMDKNYNTVANASGRAVIGHSQGGYAAFKFGMLHPDVFKTVASHSGLLLVDALFDPNIIFLLEQENQGGFAGPDPTKFFTSALYAMSAAWSPNLNNPPFYVDLPLEFHSDNHLYPVPEVVNLWHQNDVFSLLDSYHEAFNSLNGIYLDVGLLDELGTQLAHQPVLGKMDYYNVVYTFETYQGGHHTHLFERLAVALEFCSNNMN
jgi:enterochelin esterase-like enzyme